MDNLNRHFGLVIAYLLPGFIALTGIAPLVPSVAGWLHSDQTANFGAPVYAMLAATAAGMIVSCFRWLILDRIHAMTGVAGPTFNARALEKNPTAFQYVVESHYRYYQFYGNTLVAVIWAYAVHCWLRTSSLLSFGTDFGVVILCAVLFAGSRDTLAKYRNRSRQLARKDARDFEGEPMTNGIDHIEGHGPNSEIPPAQPKPAEKPEVPATPQPAENRGKQTKE